MSDRKVLRLNHEQAFVAGVVAGFAAYFDQDVNLFRIAAITLIVLTGILPGIVIYVLAWYLLHRAAKIDAPNYTIYE